MELFIIYILIGLIGGITAGMLGLGGGIIFVPGLLIVHKINDLFLGYQLQAAVYTSIICIIFAGSMSAYLHFKNNLVITEQVKRFDILQTKISAISYFIVISLFIIVFIWIQ